MTTDAEIVVAVRGETNGARTVKRQLDDLANSGDKTTSAMQRAERQMQSMDRTAQMLNRAMGGLVASLGIRELIRMADNVAMMEGRLKNATRTVDEAKIAFDGLRGITQRTGAQMETVVGVFQRLSFVRDEIKATMSEMLQFTDTVSKLGVVSGASPDAMRAGLTQLGQALSANIVRAEEWNSIMENIPAVGKTIADQFGITTGQLRQLVVEGSVLSEDMFSAMLNAAGEVEEKFQNMPMTVSRAFGALRSDFELFVGQTTQSSGAVGIMVGMIDTLRLAVHGLGVGLSAMTNIVATAGLMVLKDIENLVNGAIERINWLINAVNIVPGVDIGNLERRDWTGGLSKQEIMRAGDADLQSILQSPTPQNTSFDKIFGNDQSTLVNNTRELKNDYKKMAEELATASEETKALKKAQGDLNSLVKSTYTEQEKYNTRVKELENLRGFAKTAEEITAIERGIKAAGDELEKVSIQAERNGPVAKAFESLASEIDDGFKDAFKGAFTESDGGFKKLIAGWKSTFKDFLAELAYQALARPIILSVVVGVGGAMGVSSGARASILGTGTGGASGGGFGLGNIGSLLSNGWSAISGGLSTPMFSAGSMIGGGINSIGASLGLNNASFIGPMMPGASNLASAFTPMAGIAGFGGNMLGNLIFGGDRGIGSSIGGALGGIGGTAVGASMGTILGMAGGPVGALVGTFLGNALGGLFGGGQKRETIGASFGVEDGLLNVGYVGTKGVDGGKANEFASGLVDTLNLVAQTIGAQYISGFSMETNVGSKDRGTNFGNTRVSGNPTDVTAIVRAMINSDEHITGGGDLLGVARRSLDMNNDIEEMISDVTFAKSLLEAAKTPAELVADAMAAVNKEFDAMYERAERLALPMDKVAETLEKNREAALGMIKAQQAGFQSMEAMKATFDSWLYDQSLSGTSTLSPLEKLVAAQGNFGGLLSQVQGGDYAATQQLLQAGQQLLALGQSMYASSVEFGLLEKFVRDSIGSVAHQIGVPGYASGTRSARSGLAWVGERGPELVNFKGGERVYNAEESKMMARQMARQEADIASMKEHMASVADTNRRMERQINRLTNNLISKAAFGV